MRPSQKAHDPISGGSRDQSPKVIDENTSLLSIGRADPFEKDSTPQADGRKEDSAHDDLVAERTTTNYRKVAKVALLVVVAVATLAAMTLIGRGLNVLIQESRGEASEEKSPGTQPLSFVYAPDVANQTTTFSQLAKAMLPSWYANSLLSMAIFTPELTPNITYKTRKIMLKTRDLLDVFSPIYPNATGGLDNKDMWKSVRNQLNRGYTIVGDFQDLYNAHILHSTKYEDKKRNKVLRWKTNFDTFQQMHDVHAFLASPSDNAFDHIESHLFWGKGGRRPRGGDPASKGLHLLGSKQLERAILYWKRSQKYSNPLNYSVHEHYHDLRKQLRGLVDEYQLFKWLMFPIKAGTYPAIDVLKKARKLLGDMNDDWTAYETYLKRNKYPSEREVRGHRVEIAWNYIKTWAVRVNFEGTMKSLAYSMMEEEEDSAVSLNQFLQKCKAQPTHHFVIGNDAGDADTIVSAISLAYIESVKTEIQQTPIVSIPKADLTTQRPEVSLLLELAGISHPTSTLIFVDDDIVEYGSYDVEVTLVDHNVLTQAQQDKNWKVEEILDHHHDEGKYLDSCNGDNRNIAFANESALVASACTLVAERLSDLFWEQSYPSPVALLLLGVILLDSVNLSEEVGKVTQRDVDAVKNLISDAKWDELPIKTQKELNIINGVSREPDTTTLFDMLQKSKYDPDFWRSLSVRDALRLDYKTYYYGNDDLFMFGVSTVLMPLASFLKKNGVVDGTLQYMGEVRVDFLGIMFAYVEEGHLHRQLALCGTGRFLSMQELVMSVLGSDNDQDSLDLEELDENMVPHDDPRFNMRIFTQHNIKPSRKQIGPILRQYFQSTTTSGTTDIID